MEQINFSQKTSLVVGVADNVGFGWHIAKKLQSAGSRVIISCHPRLLNIVGAYLQREKYKESRMLSDGQEFKPIMVIPCDVELDEGEFSIADLRDKIAINDIKIDSLVHSVAFSPEIKKNHLEVSRSAYLTAMSVSSYSLISLCRNLLPYFSKTGASVLSISYIASQRAMPCYGGGMASAKAALECDARMLCWWLGEHAHRINIISPGPYASRAAKAIGAIDEMIEKTKEKSPLKRAVSAQDVANAALFLLSDFASAITGEVLYIDAGFHAMGII